MLNTTSAILAAAAEFPVAVTINTQGREVSDICESEAKLSNFLRSTGFRNSIDQARVEPAN